jgi:NTE family protein
MTKKKIKVVLSGSGLLYPMHAGAMERICEDHEVVAITGVSGGSMIGSLYAAGMTPHEVKETIMTSLPGENWKMIDVSWNPFRSWGLVTGKAFLKKFQDILPATFEDLSIPLHIGTVNIDRREHVIFNSHEHPKASVPLAVRASMGFPFAFAPVVIDGDRYVDGGVAASFPLDIYGSGNDVLGLKVVTVTSPKGAKKVKGFLDYSLALVTTMMSAIDHEHIEDALYARFIRLETKETGMNIFMKRPEAEKLYQKGYAIADAWFKSK